MRIVRTNTAKTRSVLRLISILYCLYRTHGRIVRYTSAAETTATNVTRSRRWDNNIFLDCYTWFSSTGRYIFTYLSLISEVISPAGKNNNNNKQTAYFPILFKVWPKSYSLSMISNRIVMYDCHRFKVRTLLKAGHTLHNCLTQSQFQVALKWRPFSG